MRPEEIALRMRGVTGLQTVVASRIARQLSQMGCEPRSALRELGLNERQQTQFNRWIPVIWRRPCVGWRSRRTVC